MSKLKWSALEESIGILISLYSSLDQKILSMIYYEDYLADDSSPFQKSNIPSKGTEPIDATIMDAMRFQFLIEVCSFLDEWDKFTGVRTNSEFDSKIKIIKQGVKSARKGIRYFSDLKNFRNEVLAHNYRDSKKEYSLNKIASYNVPNSISEMALVLYSVKRMLDILITNFPEEYAHAHQILLQEFGSPPVSREILNEEKIMGIIQEIEDGIEDRIFDIPKYDIVTNLAESLNSK